MRRRSAVLISLWLILAGNAGGEEAKSAVEKIMEAYGGEDAWAAMPGYEQVGQIKTTTRERSGSIQRIFVRPNRLRVSIDYEDSEHEERVLEGVRGWRGGEEVGGPMLTSMFLQAARMDLPYILASRREDVVDHGVDTRDGADVRLLEVKLAHGMSLSVEVNLETHRISRSIGRALAEGFPGGVIEFVTEYADFRDVDGRLFAFHEESFAMGHSTGKTSIETVSLAESF